MLIEWDSTLSVGNSRIDQDHEALVDIVNRLAQASDQEHGYDIIAEILSELSDYVIYHFEREEQIMRRYHYPATAQHVKQHSDLIKGLETLVYEYEAMPSVVSADTLVFLKHWLVDHIRGCDMDLGRFMRLHNDHL